jgi:hypothetical protein
MILVLLPPIREVCKTFMHRFDSGSRLQNHIAFTREESKVYGQLSKIPLQLNHIGAFPPNPNHSERFPRVPASLSAACRVSGGAA